MRGLDLRPHRHVSTASLLRPRGRPGRCRLPRAHGLERGRDPGRGRGREALLLTPKARVIAPLVVLRRGEDDFLLLTEPELGEVVRSQLLRTRFAAKCEIEPEEHTSAIVLGEGDGIPTDDYGVPAREVLDCGPTPTRTSEELERLRIEAGTPALRARDRRPRPAGRGGPGRAGRLLHQGLLPRARSRSPASTTAARRTVGCAYSSSRTNTRRQSTLSSAGREGRRARHERGSGARRSATCARRSRTAPTCRRGAARRARGYTGPSRAELRG